MTHPDTPKDDDLAAFLERKVSDILVAGAAAVAPIAPDDLAPDAAAQTLDDVLINGEEPTTALLEEINALESAAPLPDEELARQALEHPGADGDPSTPE
ncbi:hypothetical protein ACG02S_01600 [Roseateles sp. DC23W]|uniref:Uncharacterized protein n=1 Tax=Pelomonas dachongensis TaxID=3299029 RepID=A0ABW7EGK2_9BURK